MSMVEMRCPRCGSPSNLQRGKINEYVCSSCGAVFRFIDHTKRVVTTDILVRNCLHCGKPIEAGKGFKCTRCGESFFCDSCVDEVQGKYVCADCLTTAQQNCEYCKKYAVYKCLNCGRRACKLHPYEDFVHQHKRLESGHEHIDYHVRYCTTCGGYVCLDCERLAGIVFLRATCPKCHSKLDEYETFR